MIWPLVVSGAVMIAMAVYAIRDPLARVNPGASVKDFEENPEQVRADAYMTAHLVGTMFIILGIIFLLVGLFKG